MLQNHLITNEKLQHKALFKEDKVISTFIDKVDIMTWKSTDNVFQDIMSCIIEQQIHYRSSKNTFRNLMLEAGLEELNIQNFYIFEPVLKNVRLSEAKYEAVVETVQFFNNGNINWNDLNDEGIRFELEKIRGIGRWTVDMILLFTLRRPDIFPYDDYHLSQIMPKLYGLDPKNKLAKNMITIANQWQGFRSLGVLYMLAWKNQNLNIRRGKVS